MISKAYVVNLDDTEVNAAIVGLDRLEIGYSFVNRDSMKKLSLGPETCLIGDVIDMKRVLHAAGVKRNLTSYPAQLRRFLKREISESTVGEVVRDVLGGKNLFVKPCEDKQFIPAVLEKDSVELFLMHLNDDTKVFTSEPVTFESEFRVFVCKGKIIGVRETGGSKSNVDWHMVDFDFVREAEKTVQNSPDLPKTLIMDFGLMETESGPTTALVECNPGYAFGSYGLCEEKMVKVLFACWEEMVEKEFEFSFSAAPTTRDIEKFISNLERCSKNVEGILEKGDDIDDDLLYNYCSFVEDTNDRIKILYEYANEEQKAAMEKFSEPYNTPDAVRFFGCGVCVKE